MTTLMYSDTLRSPNMRHAVPHAVADPFLYIEDDGSRRVVVRSLEVARMAEVPGLEPFPEEEFGLDGFNAAGMSDLEVHRHTALEACHRFGIRSATVPHDFPVQLADLLRSDGIELNPDGDWFNELRRAKTAVQIEGVRRAQLGAEAAVKAIAALLAAASSEGDTVTLDGEPLTSERLKIAARDAFAASGVASGEFIVAHGYQTCVGHHMGSGIIGVGEPITVDLWPYDEETGMYTDMTRTFVVGEVNDELATYHRLARESLEASVAAVRPGAKVRDIHGISCEPFERAGYPTQRTRKPGEVLLEGFFHSLGHGVGLEVHEAPRLGDSDEVLVEGDVLALEPGCYRQGFGGVRLEDLVIVTADGAERVTNYPYELTPVG